MKLINVTILRIFTNITRKMVDKVDKSKCKCNVGWLPSGWLPYGWLPSGRLPIWLFSCGSACAMCWIC